MADCPNCALPLPAGAPACANCGRVVVTGSPLPVFMGIILGVGAAIAALGLFLEVSAAVGPAIDGAGAHVWPARAVDLLFAGLSIGAFGVGIAAARRRAIGIAFLFIIPATLLLGPATACTVSTFSAR